ncbi:MAG: tetratricopeptide repeat protein [Prevotella sp.]
MEKLKKNTGFIGLWLLLLCCLALPSQARRDKIKRVAPQAVKADSLSYEASRRYNYFFLEAVRQQNAGHYDAAFDLINYCLQLNPNAAEAYFMRSGYYSELNLDSLDFADLVKAATLQPSNDTYQERLAEGYLNTGKYDKAIETYENLYSNNRSRSDVLGDLVQLYKQQKDYDGMLRTIRRIEQVEGESDQTAMMKMNVYELKGDEKNAYKTLKMLADTHPIDQNYTLMLGNWLMQHKGQKEAYKLYTEALNADPSNVYAQSAMYDYYRAMSQDSLANGMMNRILLGKNTPQKSRIQFLRQAIMDSEERKDDSTEVVKLIDRVQQVVPTDTLVAQMRVAYYSMKKFPKPDVNKALSELLELQPDNAGTRMQLIQNEWDSGNWKKIDSLSTPGMLYNPDEMAFYYFSGLSRWYEKDNRGALDALQRGTRAITDKSNRETVGVIYSILGEIYHNMGNKAQSFAAYDSCLQWKPDDVVTLNNYAYYLGEEGVSLKKAEEMSAKAVKAEPKNATYLDTYAWVLYKQKRYAEAKIYIDMALKFTADSTNDATLREHAGDIYVGLKNYTSAVEFYKQALQQGGDIKTLNRKINLYRRRK